MSKKASIIITLAMIIIIALTSFAIIATKFIDYNYVSSNFINKLKISQQNIEKVKIVKFPIPHLIINYIKEEGRLELENVEIHFKPLSLLVLNPKISLVQIDDVKIYSNKQEFNVINHDEIINSFAISEVANIDFNIKNLTILDKDNSSIVTLSNCSLYNTNLASNIEFKGNIVDVGRITGFFKKKANQMNFDLTIANNHYNFHLLETYIDNQLVSGKGEYLVQNLVNVLHEFIPDLSSVFRRFNQNEKLNIKFDLLPTRELLKLENLTINSNSFLGKGLIYLSKSKDVSSVINLYFPKIDTQSLISSSSNIGQLEDSAYGLRLIFGDKSITSNISVDQIILADNEMLNNIKLLLNLENGVLEVKDFSGIIKSGGNFQFIGNITQNSVRSIFNGTVHLQHKDLNSILNIIGYRQATSKNPTPFILSSNLKLTLIDLYLQNFSLKTDNANITGNITARFIGSMPHLITNIELSSLDLDKDDYPIISPLVQFGKNLSENMKDDSYLSKYIPIRTVDYLGNFDITINNMVINNDSFGKVYILANVSPNNVGITNFDIRRGNNYVNLSANLSATSIKPQFYVKINDGSFDINFLQAQFLLDLRNKLLNEFDLEKIDFKLNSNLSKITQGDLILQNFKFSLENSGSLLKIDNIEANVLSGKLKAEGNILLDPYTINFVYALNSIDLGQLSAILPKGLLDNQGGASFNGTIHTTGDNLAKLLYELNIQSQFIIKNAKINNFSVDQLIEKINDKKYNSENLNNDVIEAMSQGRSELDNLHSSLQLKNGIITIQDALFNTKYSTGSVSLAINIYNYQMSLSSILSFYISNPNLNAQNNKDIPVNLKIKASGTIYNPVKVPDYSELVKILNSQKKSL